MEANSTLAAQTRSDWSYSASALAHGIDLLVVIESKSSGKSFSPQNWLKSGQAVNHEQLVAETIVNELKRMEMADSGFINSLSLPAPEFVQRWSAE